MICNIVLKNNNIRCRTWGLPARRTCPSTNRGCRSWPRPSPCTPWWAVWGTIWQTTPWPCQWRWFRSVAELFLFRYGIVKIPVLNSAKNKQTNKTNEKNNFIKFTGRKKKREKKIGIGTMNSLKTSRVYS